MGDGVEDSASAIAEIVSSIADKGLHENIRRESSAAESSAGKQSAAVLYGIPRAVVTQVHVGVPTTTSPSIDPLNNYSKSAKKHNNYHKYFMEQIRQQFGSIGNSAGNAGNSDSNSAGINSGNSGGRRESNSAEVGDESSANLVCGMPKIWPAIWPRMPCTDCTVARSV